MDGALPLPLRNANLPVLTRVQTPMELQGRAFAAQGTLQFCAFR